MHRGKLLLQQSRNRFVLLEARFGCGELRGDRAPQLAKRQSLLAEGVVEIVAEECLGHRADLCHVERRAGESVVPHVGIGTVVGSGVGTVVGNGVGTVVGGIGTAVGSGIGTVVGSGVGTAVGSEIGTVFGGNSTVVGSGISTLVGSGVGMVVRRRIADMDRLRGRKTSEAKNG